MYDVGLASRIRSFGVGVVEIAGWQTRGSSTFNPKGAVNHHTAGSPNGAAPSLAICIYGRSDLPGPLCHVLLGRDLKAYVIAAGRANHAGSGGWRGLSGNTSVHGLEIEHVGTGWTDTTKAQLKIATRIHAAFLTAPGSTGDPALVAQHFEWAPTRKVDFRELNPYTTDLFRHAIGLVLTDKRSDYLEEDEMIIIQHPTGAAVLLHNGTLAGVKSAADLTQFEAAGIAVVPVSDKTWQEFHAKYA